MRHMASILFVLWFPSCVSVPTTIYVPMEPRIARCPDVSGVVLVEGLFLFPSPQKPAWSGGTAFVVRRHDDVVYGVTCHHCVDRHIPGSLRADGFLAEVWAIDEDADLAVLRWKTVKPYRVYPLGKPELGQTVWLAGFTRTARDKPKSLRFGPPVRHIRRGIVSWLRHNILGFDGGTWRGFSGGPLLTADGKVVGVMEMSHGILSGFSVAIHPRHVEPLLHALPP